MKTRILLALAAGSLFLSAAAPAETYYVRNRPFKQVIKTGGEAMVGAEAFLRALGLNWNLNGNVVTLTTQPASNPPLPVGTLTFRHGQNEARLDTSARGGSTYVSLRPLARLAEFGVTENRASGTVDVAKARFATEDERKLVGEVAAAKAQEEKAVMDAWAKKSAELKAKREAEEAAAKEGDATEEGNTADAGKTGDGGKTGKTGKSSDKAAATPSPSPSPAADVAATDKPKEEVKEVPKEARLEVFRVDARPEPASGTVIIEGEVKNMGDAPSKGVSGLLTLRGPSQSTSATEANAASQSRVWLSKPLSGPAIAPGASWKFTERYRHPSGNSMPLGNITSDFKLNSTK